MQKIIKNLDQLKNDERATLGKCEEKSEGYYNGLIHQSHIPLAGITMSEVIEELNKFIILAKKTPSSRSLKGHSPVSRWEMNWLRTRDGRKPS